MSDLDVRYIANLARLALSDEEIERYQGQLGQVLEYMEQLGKLDVEGIEPTAHANPIFDVIRDDEADPERCLDREEVLRNAPEKSQDQFRVTKVVEQA